jgi:hypothetical protein
MSTPLWVGELAEQFWATAGEPPPFPRDLQRAVALALPLAIVDLPRLRVAAIDTWLARNRSACRLGVGDRRLRACLVAHGGCGVVFLDGADPPAEHRFSLAHETAHFLVDYWQPRARAVARLGPPVLEVLDGRRAPAPTERIDAVLASVPLGAHVHLMDRTPDRHLASAREDAAERRADLLALEMLAPWAAVEAALAEALDAAGRDGAAVRRVAVDLLITIFGLPVAVATSYAPRFVPPEPTASPFLQRLGLAP